MASNYVKNSYSTIRRKGRRLQVTIDLSMGDKRDLERLQRTITRLNNILSWQTRLYRYRKTGEL